MESNTRESLVDEPGLEQGVTVTEEERKRIVAEEEKVLQRVVSTLERRQERTGAHLSYDVELLSLRDQIREARLEDIPPLIEEMERLQQVAARRAEVREGVIDNMSPYFGRLVLEEDERKREVLIGRATYLDPRTGLRVVDWRDAPVSRLYYRYDEGDDYEEHFGGRDVEGTVLTRRSLVIQNRTLYRVSCPQGVFLRRKEHWDVVDASHIRLTGGQGTALRPENYHKPGKLGLGLEGQGQEERYLPEITALIDPMQFELITRPDSGVVVIQGGAGSGKTTIGLHRMAYLAFQDSRRFRADKMMVVVFNHALARYISRVLPALGVDHVLVNTYEDWAHKHRVQNVRGLPALIADETPAAVVRFKKHPVMLRVIDAYVARLDQKLTTKLQDLIGATTSGTEVTALWSQPALSLAQRLEKLVSWLGSVQHKHVEVHLGIRHAVERFVRDAKVDLDVAVVWSEMLTDKTFLNEIFDTYAPQAFRPEELESVHRWCNTQCSLALSRTEDDEDDYEPSEDQEDESRSVVGVDGVVEDERARIDAEDDAILLRLAQRLRGGLRRGRDKLQYEHIFIDEAQDLSPMELAVITDSLTAAKSVTLAGDVAQRLLMDNGFTTWSDVLRELGLDHVQVQPLRFAYRSTEPILEFAQHVLGPLAEEKAWHATRSGAPVELFRFVHTGDMVGFLAEALRDLAQAERFATVALIARYPEQADVVYRGLERAEVPNLRRIAEQDFPFRPGVDVTDVRQVKGLEFDYVVLLDVSDATYPQEDEARHLLHIGATRAAHQLWLTVVGNPSPLVPKALGEKEFG